MTSSASIDYDESVFVSDFEYDLPPELIVQRPLPHRDDSRMMAIWRKERKIVHIRLKDFPDYLIKGDLLAYLSCRMLFGNKCQLEVIDAPLNGLDQHLAGK